MPRSLITSRRALPITLTLTTVAAFLPDWALRWTRAPAEMLHLVVGPFSDAGVRLGAAIRPPRSPGGAGPYDEAGVLHLREQVAEFERLYRAEQAKVEELQRQLEQIQKLPRDLLDVPVRPVGAAIVLRSPRSAFGIVVLNRGSNSGVRAGTVAVYDGVHLLGRVTHEVSAVQSSLMPLANVATGYVTGRIIPADRPDLRIADAPAILLEPTGDGDFTGSLDKTTVVEAGSTVRLHDPTWPPSAQAMVIGHVESVEPNDLEPLRNTIRVRPAYQPSQVSRVLLKIEADAAGAMP